MKINLKRSLFILSFIYAFSLNAQVQQIVNLSTGFNNQTNTLFGNNIIDDTWTVIPPSGGTVNTRTTAYSSWQNPVNSKWVSNHVNLVGNPTAGPVGVYQYRATFNLTGQINCGKLIINNLGADNRVLSLTVNGVSYPITLPLGNHFDPMINSQIVIQINPLHLISGANIISFSVENVHDDSVTGFNFRGEIIVNENINILPNVTGPTQICEGSPITFSGTLNAGSDPCTHYEWKIFECTSTGSMIAGGFSWSSWYVGTPSGNFTFPSSLNLTCGKFYMAVMAAVRESYCSNWAQDFVVFKYNCKPTVNAGPDQTICEGECATLVSEYSKFHSYTWSSGGNVINNTNNLVVCPTATSTYTSTSLNTLTGCSNTDQVVVTVLPNNPLFNISTNVANPNYYTISATPVVLNANLVPGFGAYWSVEELDANNNSLYNFQNPSAWYPYPTACTFKGFDDYNLNYSGIYTSVPSSPTNGQFVYNKTYRITRGTWNNNCSFNGFAYILKTVKSANGEPQVIVEETKAPNFMDVKPESINLWSVSPNPSSGIFAISNPSYETKETTLEIYDLFGKKVLEKTIETGLNATTIDISGHINGMYILRISSEGESFTHKIILE